MTEFNECLVVNVQRWGGRGVNHSNNQQQSQDGGACSPEEPAPGNVTRASENIICTSPWDVRTRFARKALSASHRDPAHLSHGSVDLLPSGRRPDRDIRPEGHLCPPGSPSLSWTLPTPPSIPPLPSAYCRKQLFQRYGHTSWRTIPGRAYVTSQSKARRKTELFLLLAIMSAC